MSPTLRFNLAFAGTEPRYTHFVMPDGTVDCTHCRPCLYDVSVGVLRSAAGFTRQQYLTLRRMQSMALLLAPQVVFEFGPGLLRMIQAQSTLCGKCKRTAA